MEKYIKVKVKETEEELQTITDEQSELNSELKSTENEILKLGINSTH